MLGEAVKSVQRGFSVFPVQDYEKTPHVTTPPYTIKWSEVATSDLRRVLQLWGQWPEANIGVACKPSRLLVVDCDIPKRDYVLKGTRWEYLHDAYGPLVDGDSVFNEVCYRHGGDWDYTQATYRVTTGSGGIHYYFWWPWELQATQASIVKGVLDIRCNGGDHGGYVLGEGSSTASGTYVRSSGATVVLETPDWLVDLCREQETRYASGGVSGYQKGGSLSYGGLADAVMYAGEGNRNNCLLWASRAMCDDGASETECHDTLGSAAEAAGLTKTEIRDTIRSAYRLQGSKR